MATPGISLREWRIDANDYATEDDFRQAVANELASFEHIGERLGVGVVALPAREKGENGFYTRGWVFKCATVPAVQADASEIEALEDALAEPVAAE